jgi:hypothetical protein
MNDPRTEKARLLGVKKVGNRQYRVGKWWVDLTESEPCYCEDAILRGTPRCKHVLAALMHEDQMKRLALKQQID